MGRIADGMFQAGRFQESAQAYSEVLDAARQVGNKGLELKALEGCGRAFVQLAMSKLKNHPENEFRRASRFFEQALTLAKSLGNRSEEGRLLRQLGSASRFLPIDSMGGWDWRQPIANLDEALRIARVLGDKREEGRCLFELATTYAVVGDTKKHSPSNLRSGEYFLSAAELLVSESQLRDAIQMAKEAALRFDKAGRTHEAQEARRLIETIRGYMIT
jgi:tetratricopeptide (TPR) repeat protein